MASSRTVRIVLTGDSAGLVRALKVAGDASEETQSKFEKMQSVGRGLSSIGKTMMAMAAPLVGVGYESVKAAASFQGSMEKIHTQAGRTQAQVNSFSRSVQNLAPQVGLGPSVLADGLYHVASTGLKAADSMKVLKIAAEGAQVGGADLTDVTNALDATVVSGIKGVNNYQQAMGVLNKTVGVGDMTMQDLADALGTGILGNMRKTGLGIKDVGAALAVFGDNNKRGAEAATSLQSAIRIMAAPSVAASKALAGIGLSSLQLSRDMHKPDGLVTALSDLRAHLHGLSQPQQELALTRAFGGRQSTGVQLLLSQLPRLQKKYEELTGGQKGFGAAWNSTTKTASFQFAQMRASVEANATKLGASLLPIARRYLPMIVSGISALVGWFTHLSKPMQGVIVGFTVFLAIGGPILIMIGSIVEAIGTIGGALTAVGITMDAIPIVALVAGIAAAGIYLGTHWQQTKFVVMGALRAIGGAVVAAGKAMGTAFTAVYRVMTWPFVQAWKVIRTIFDGIVSAVRWVVSKVTGAFHTITSIPGHLLSGAGSLLHSATFGLLHTGGPVKAKYYDMGGPVGTDTIPGWLSPGEYVLNRAATARVGVGALNTLNAGGDLGGTGNITIEPGTTVVQINARAVAEAVTSYTLKRAARGSSSLVGGGLLTGSRTA